MEIILDNLGKRYNHEWIFRKINYSFIGSNKYVIAGSNGSGKSTLLQVISGSILNSEGIIRYVKNKIAIPIEKIYTHISIAAPYLDLYEEFTLAEAIEFHKKFKPFYYTITTAKAIDILNLNSSKNKQIKHFSSGMKQRLKLALALFSETDVLFLDEPSSNLDKKSMEWYLRLLPEFSRDRIVFICSNNIEHDVGQYNYLINIEDYKK